jgi:general nucleoside transport system permease protein
VSSAVTGPLREPGQDIPRTRLLPAPALLPAVGTGGLHGGLYVALGAVALVGVLLFQTVPGFRIRAVGLNPEAASAAGLPVGRTLLLAFCISGALAGLAGAVQLAGVSHRVYGGSSPGTGYSAIAVALVGGLHPVGVLLAALFFGGLVAGSNEMQRTAGVSSVIASVIQALALFLLIAGPRFRGATGRESEISEDGEGRPGGVESPAPTGQLRGSAQQREMEQP